jgi:uncharacterized repeat protein (TIGR03803 family)
MNAKSTFLPVFALIFLFVFNGVDLKAQSLWAPTFSGGATNAGTLMQLNTDGSGFTKVYDFNENNGSSPMGSVIQAANGKVYGTCVNGGADSSCVIYCFDPATNTYTDLWNFDIIHGDFPMSGMIQGPNGILYGAGSAGGLDSTAGSQGGAGVIYSFDPATNTYTELYALNDSVGYAPCGSPLLASDGKLYGLTSGFDFYYDSMMGFGSIYSYDINAGIYTNLHNFAGVTDGFGFGSLIERSGIFYGMTSGKPQYAPEIMEEAFNFILNPYAAVNQGNLFSYNPATQTYTSLYNFDSVSGGAPYGSLFYANDGKLYGTTSAGGINNLGVIFSFDITTSTYAKMFDFDNTHGAAPMGDLMQSTDGNLYGTTSAGGAYGSGVVFRFDPVGLSCTVMNNFDGVSGSAPLSGALTWINTKAATGILTPVSNLALSVYPVPAHDYITVSIPSATGESPVFILSDLDGRTVWGPAAPAATGNGEFRLNLDMLESGVYLLRATTGDNVITKKIVRE